MARLNQFTRDTLQEIRNEASSVAEHTANPQWQRAWQALADAADRLDAMMVRSSVGTEAIRG